MIWRPLQFLFLFLIALVTFPIVGFAADRNKTLRVAFEVAETAFDPIVQSDHYSNAIIENIFDPMLQYDYLTRPVKLQTNTLEAMPQVSDNGATYLFKIQKGIYFTPDPAFKGEKRELTAKDYAYSLRRLLDPHWKSPWLFLIDGKILGADPVIEQAKKTNRFDYDAPIAGLEVVDRYTLRVKLKQPDYNFLYIMAMPATGAVAREVVEKYGNDVGSHPVGTGPYILKEWKRSSKMVLEANPDYREVIFNPAPSNDPWDQDIIKKLKGKRLPMIGRIEVDVIEEDQPRWLAFLNKEHDFIENLPNDFINYALPNKKLAPNLAKQDVKVYRNPDMEVIYTYFNMEDPIVGGYTREKIALRRAISLAYNLEEEIRIIRKNEAVPAQSPVGPGAAGYDPDFKNPFAEYNPAKAKALLDMFGYVDRDGDGYRELPDGKPLVIEYASVPTQRYRQFDELWRKSMDAIGVRITFRKERWPDLTKAAKLGKLQIKENAWHADYPDADNFLQLLYGPNSGQANDARFRLPVFDKLYEKARLLPDSPERTQLYHEMSRLMVVYAPWKLSVHRLRTHLIYSWTLGFKKHPISVTTWRYMDIDLEKQKAARK